MSHNGHYVQFSAMGDDRNPCLLGMNRLTREENFPDAAQRMRYRRDASYASLLAMQAVEGLFPLIGGQGLASDNPIGRHWRDAHAVHQHIALTWDNHGTAYGEWLLGAMPQGAA